MRSALSILVCTAAVAAPWAWPQGAEAGEGQRRPNVIVITTDDQPLSMLQGQYMPQTAKHIAAKGTTFANSIVTTPLCCPSRASLLTGQYAHNHGVLRNAYSLLEGKDNVLPVWLREAGYRTAHLGKFLNGYESTVDDRFQVAPGWDIWFTTLGATRYYQHVVSGNGRKRHFGRGKRSYVTRVLNRKAASLVRRFAPDTRPFYIQLDHRAPHPEVGPSSGGRCGAKAIPEDKRDMKRFRDVPLSASPSLNELDVSDKPSFISNRPPLSEGQLRRITRRYDCGLASLRSVDRGVEKVVKNLKRVGELDDTVLVYTSDNGFYFGEHRIGRDKTQPYEEGVRVPLLMRVPKRFRGGAPPVPTVHEPVANIDLAPTILRFARARPCAPGGDCRVMDGRSLMPLLGGSGDWPQGRGLAVEYDGAGSKGKSSCRFEGVRAEGWIYVRHLAIPDPVTGVCEESEEVELYNLSTDPFQLENLSGQDQPVTDPLRHRLALLRDCSGIEGRDPAPADASHCE